MKPFRFKQFAVCHEMSAQKVGLDSIVLGSLVKCRNIPHKILDIGAGCGLLSLMMAQKYSDAEVIAVEVDADSHAECRGNFHDSPWPARLSVVNADINAVKPFAADLIICNPPYFAEQTGSDTDSRRIARQGETFTLFSLPEAAARFMTGDSELWTVIPTDSLDAFISISSRHGLYPSSIIRILHRERAAEKRVVVCLTMQETKSTDERLILYEADGEPTDAFRSVASAYYLHF